MHCHSTPFHFLTGSVTMLFSPFHLFIYFSCYLTRRRPCDTILYRTLSAAWGRVERCRGTTALQFTFLVGFKSFEATSLCMCTTSSDIVVKIVIQNNFRLLILSFSTEGFFYLSILDVAKNRVVPRVRYAKIVWSSKVNVQADALNVAITTQPSLLFFIVIVLVMNSSSCTVQTELAYSVWNGSEMTLIPYTAEQSSAEVLLSTDVLLIHSK